MSSDPLHPSHTTPQQKGDKGLFIIGIFKLLKCAFFVSVGFGALHFLHHDLADKVQQIVESRGFDPENHFVSLILRESEQLTHHRLRMISLGTFAYAALALLEGVGLMLRKTWAEYLTLWLSVSFLPWEIFEMVRHPAPWRFVVFLGNVLIVLYLLWFLRRKNRKDRLEAEAAK